MKKTILLADDNKNITDILSMYLKSEGYTPIVAADGEEALRLFRVHSPCLALLDVMMPKKDGLTVCREIRSESEIPIIMITAKGEDTDKIMGLDFGADDYVVKPFSPAEVVARVRAQLRRNAQKESEPEKVLQIYNLMIDLSSYIVRINDQPLTLTKKEIEILWLLAENKNKVFSREILLDRIWGYDYFGDLRTVDTHIKRLRSKLSIDVSYQWDIKTVWGVGYKFEVEANDK